MVCAKRGPRRRHHPRLAGWRRKRLRYPAERGLPLEQVPM